MECVNCTECGRLLVCCESQGTEIMWNVLTVRSAAGCWFVVSHREQNETVWAKSGVQNVKSDVSMQLPQGLLCGGLGITL
jgi:hypothetical protein